MHRHGPSNDDAYGYADGISLNNADSWADDDAYCKSDNGYADDDALVVRCCWKFLFTGRRWQPD